MSPTATTYAESLETLVGKTPLVSLQRVRPPNGARLWVKLGAFNPTGSDDDRAALEWLELARSKGQLAPGARFVVPSLGNFAISLAWLCASRALGLVAVVPDNVTLDRRALLRAYGAEVVLVPAEAGLAGAGRRAAELARERNLPLVEPFADERTSEAISAGFESLADELVEAHRSATAAGTPLVVVTGLGDGPALGGLARRLLTHAPDACIRGVSPERAVSRLQELSTVEGATGKADVALEKISDEEARAMQGRVAREEGLLLGIASGAAIAAAFRRAASLPSEVPVYVVCPDTGERDFSLEELFR